MEKIIDIRPIKAELRSKIKESRSSMDKTVKSAFDKKIKNKFLNLWKVRETDTFLCYVSTPLEVDTSEIIKSLLSSGKKVAVPRCEKKAGEMSFHYINSLDELSPGSFGVPEPEDDESTKVTKTKNTVCIVPAFAFDRFGYRLGYGKGYYDRFLARYEGVSVGICYEENLKDELFRGKHDRRVDMIITEKQIVNVEKGRYEYAER